jgi:nucleolar protein 56
MRGKIARALAGKISIAAKVDFYGDRDASAELLSALAERIADIRKRYPNPPKKPARGVRGRGSKGGRYR